MRKNLLKFCDESNDLLASRRLLSPEHCLKLGSYFGNKPKYWMRLQNHYLFRKTQREKASVLNAIVPLQPVGREVRMPQNNR